MKKIIVCSLILSLISCVLSEPAIFIYNQDTPDDIAAFSAPFAQIQQLAEKEQLAEFIETFDQFKLAMADFNSKIEEHVEQMKTLGRLDDVIAADLTEDEAEQDIVKEEVLVQQ
ncbi:uncharacterized protein LOC126879876 isoform X2 [Diabrotica virgifera virgifera]|uniref:Uncharacterized protein LOC114336059 isoform X2 n=1 Tax=Diabrotica virgifera virgifera TaxID=50390 RepID=A0A6P7GBF6_DIAVI|nr:uncharacterized protein LOC126879876 isoform X2 [Diabrotica virgifera virgifera]